MSGETFIRWVRLFLVILCCALINGGQTRAAATISGVVYQDYNDDGVRNPTSSPALPAIDNGMANVLVTAYDSTGAVVGTAITAANGSYTLNAGGNAPYRLEFSNLPAGYQPAAFGTTNDTSVQFIPNNGTVTDVDFGVNLPRDYCQNDPQLITNCYVFGNQVSGPNANLPTLVSFSYSFSTPPGGPSPADTAQGLASQIGTTWGLAHHRLSDIVFVGTYYKAYTGMGPTDSTGVIFSVPAAAGTAGNAIFVDLNLLPGFNGAGVNTHTNVPPGYDFDLETDASRNSVGNIGLGDVEISDDQLTLFVVNLAQRQLVTIPIGQVPTAPTSAAATNAIPAAGQVGQFDVPSPCAVASDARPFGLGARNGLVYIGGVCNGQSTVTAGNPNGDPTSLRAYIYVFNPVSYTFSGPVLNFPLNFTRQNVFGSALPADPNSANWRAWTDTPPLGRILEVTPGNLFANPQPMLTDIEFDRGDLIIGMRDRFADQSPRQTPRNGVSAGDLLRAFFNGSGWVLENNGSNPLTGVTTLGTGNVQGPGGGEWYYQEDWGGMPGAPFHDEISQGGLVQVPGFPDIVQTVFDPQRNVPGTFFAGGVTWNNNALGTYERNYELYDRFTAGSFRKAGGLGDMEVLCSPAPVEIGNRVWLDTTLNGIQDPDENPLAGVVVELFDPTTNTVVSTATTNAQGEYYFSNGTNGPAGTTASAARYSQPISFFGNYIVRIDTTQAILTPYFVTLSNSGGGAIPDQNDNDGVLTGIYSQVAIVIGGVGRNNHTYDFGFSLIIPPTATPPGLPTAPGGGGGTPGAGGGPVISKSVNPPFAGPGDTVTWTITVSNPTAVALPNVGMTDTLPGELTVTNASASAGNVTVNGNTVDWSIGSLAPGQTVTITISTRVNANVRVPFAIRNTANLVNYAGSASADLLSVTRLPNTGATPLWVVGIAVLGIAIILAGRRWLRTR